MGGMIGMKKAYRIMAATLTMAVILGNVDLSVFATEASYSVNETEEVSVEDVVSDNPIVEVIENQTDENSLDEISESKEIQSENTETVDENNEDFSEPTETVLTVNEQVTEAETLEDEIIEETEDTVSGNSIEIEEPTETSPTDGDQDEEAETLNDNIVKFLEAEYGLA